MREWFGRLFAGRRGPDAVCGVLFVAGLALSVVAWLTKSQLLGWLVYLPWVLALLRMFSTRLEQRYQENRRFVQWWQGLKAKLQGLRRPGAAQPGATDAHGRAKNGPYVPDSAAYHPFACPACGQKLRVPKGRGKVVVTCPKCGREFIERA